MKRKSDDYESKWQINIELYFQILNCGYPLDANEGPYCTVHILTICAPIQRCTTNIRASIIQRILCCQDFWHSYKRRSRFVTDMPLK